MTISVMTHDEPKSHTVAVAVYDGVELLDVAGPVQVLDTAARVSSDMAAYRPVLVAERAGFVRTAAGVPLVADRSWHDLTTIDTLLVPGGLDPRAATLRPLVEPALVSWLRTEPARSAARIVSVCTGAHLLAAAGLLDGRRATTHWATAALLADDHESVEVVPDAIYVRDEPFWTSAGVSAGVDLALALVAADHGHDLARRVAQWLVAYLRRPGGQSQFSAFVRPHRSVPERIAELLTWIAQHPAEDLSVEALAERAGISPRHLARLFREQAGSPPASYVERVRLQAAIDRLVQTDAPLSAVSTAAGFHSVETLHRSFRRWYGVTPGEYRRRFTLLGDQHEMA